MPPKNVTTFVTRTTKNGSPETPQQPISTKKPQFNQEIDDNFVSRMIQLAHATDQTPLQNMIDLTDLSDEDYIAYLKRNSKQK